MSGEKRLLEALLATTRLIAANHPLQEVVHRLAEELNQVLNADRCSVLILDEENHQLAFHDSLALSQWERDNIRFRMGEGVAGWVAQNREPVLIEDVSKDPRFKQHDGQLRRMVSMICVPLEMHRRLIGVLTLTTGHPDHVFVQEELELVVLIAAHISLALESHRLYELSVLDGLTNIYNRRYLDQRLSQELADSRRHQKPISVALLDLDNFKKLNDTYGHQAGDQVLCELTGLISKELRQHDVLARYGGEEFALILAGTANKDATFLAERLRKLVADRDFFYKNQRLPVTISLGLGTYPEDGDEKMALLRTADKNLYRAKELGRNRVVSTSHHS
ncbi:MAG: sensor domain-containing diguanylate cyclase [Candidatus Eremiobacteraeota bacterium]|nr:sensor domain-containing diguanylate cyclase [Candidatus Eremiobacteraeota bacterium]